MSDLIQRLRSPIDAPTFLAELFEANKQRKEAAAEIERLQKRVVAAESAGDTLTAECVARFKRAESAERQRDEAIAALRELVRLKDMRDEIRRLQNGGDWPEQNRAVEMNAEYYRRKPLAWESARRVLKQKDG